MMFFVKAHILQIKRPSKKIVTFLFLIFQKYFQSTNRINHIVLQSLSHSILPKLLTIYLNSIYHIQYITIIELFTTNMLLPRLLHKLSRYIDDYKDFVLFLLDLKN